MRVIKQKTAGIIPADVSFGDIFSNEWVDALIVQCVVHQQRAVLATFNCYTTKVVMIRTYSQRPNSKETSLDSRSTYKMQHDRRIPSDQSQDCQVYLQVMLSIQIPIICRQWNSCDGCKWLDYEKSEPICALSFVVSKRIKLVLHLIYHLYYLWGKLSMRYIPPAMIWNCLACLWSCHAWVNNCSQSCHAWIDRFIPMYDVMFFVVDVSSPNIDLSMSRHLVEATWSQKHCISSFASHVPSRGMQCVHPLRQNIRSIWKKPR